MNALIWLFVFLCGAASGWLWGYFRGWRKGETKERDRCHTLCHQAVLRRWSGTTRWVMNAIASGERQLMDPDEFFPPGAHPPKTHESLINTTYGPN